MNVLNRRIFVKTLLATAAGSSPAHAAFHKGRNFVFPSLEAEDTSGTTHIESGNRRITISPAGTPLTYQACVRSGTSRAHTSADTSEDWKPASLPGALVTGPSFPLISSRVRRDGLRVQCDGEAEAEGLDGKSLKYVWDAEITAPGDDHPDPWVRFRTTLHLPAPLRLHEGSTLEP